MYDGDCVRVRYRGEVGENKGGGGFGVLVCLQNLTLPPPISFSFLWPFSAINDGVQEPSMQIEPPPSRTIPFYPLSPNHQPLPPYRPQLTYCRPQHTYKLLDESLPFDLNHLNPKTPDTVISSCFECPSVTQVHPLKRHPAFSLYTSPRHNYKFWKWLLFFIINYNRNSWGFHF